VPRRRIADDDETPPRRRRGAAAIAREPEAERGLAMRMLLHSPKDMVAGALAFAAVTAIIANALFLQAGPHPSPMFGSVVVMPAPLPSVSPLPRPRPTESMLLPAEVSPSEPKAAAPRYSDVKASDVKASDVKGLEVKPLELKAPETKAPEMKASEMRPADPLAGLVKATTGSTRASIPVAPRPPALIPVSHNDSGLSPGGTRRVAAVQRALAESGYGQLKPTGTIGSETQAAIAKFEHDRRIPVTGQMSDRLVHELSAMMGRPIE
jgi:hypothetical protein